MTLGLLKDYKDALALCFRRALFSPRSVFAALCFRRALFALVFVLVAFAFLPESVFAQNQVAQIAVGSSALVYDTDVNDGNESENTWTITGPGGLNVTNVTNSGLSQPWTVSYPKTGGSFHVGVPANAPLGSYSYVYADSTKVNNAPDPPVYGGGTGSFVVVSPIPALAPGAPYPWQSSVGGVNTANGNKMTTIPITGFAVPGGMSISLSLTHNSQMTYSNFNGQKWTFNYLDFLVVDNLSAPGTIMTYWGDGRSYPFVANGSGQFVPPTGIYDTLTGSGTSYKLLTQNQITYNFTRQGSGGNAKYLFLTSIVDQNGNTINIKYVTGSNFTVDSVYYNNVTGRALTFGYTSGLMTSVTDPPTATNPSGRTWTFGYNGNGELTTITLPLLNGAYHSYVIGYDATTTAPAHTVIHHDIISFTDLNGNTAQFGYNFTNANTTSDKMAWAQDPMGNTTTFGYDASSGTGQTTTITDANANQTKQVYAIQLRSVTDALNDTASFDYDTYNTRTSQTDMLHNTTTYGISYDQTKTPVQVKGALTTDPLGNMTTTAYTGTNKISSVTAPAPNGTAGATVMTTYAYGSPMTGVNDVPLSVTDPNGHSTTYVYAVNNPYSAVSNTSQWGLPSEVDTPYTSKTDLHQTYFGYDANGYLDYVTKGTQGDKVTSVYDNIGWLQSTATYPSTVLTDTTNYTYDAWGRVTTVAAPDGTTTNTTYDLNGNVLRVEDANASDGALHGGIAWTSGFFGNAILFNGTTGWVDLGNKADLDFTGAITLSALINPNSAAGIQNIIAHGTGSGSDVALRINNGSYEIESYNSGTGRSEGTSSTIPSGDINHNQWVNLIGTFDGTTWRLYRNGTQVASSSGTTGAVAVSGDWALGATGAGNARFFNGTIDDVRVFDRAVLAPEVAQLSNPGGPSTVSDGLLGYWRLDDGTGAATTVDWCHSVTNAYDADNRLVWTFNGHLDWMQYFYDASNSHSGHVRNPFQAEQLGLLSYKTDGNGHTTYYVYDQDNRPVQTVLPDGTTPGVTYDADGNVLTRLDANGITTDYTYDKDNRLTDKKYFKGSNPYTLYGTYNVHLDYYPDSALEDMMDAAGTTTWTYDNAGNVLSVGGGRGTVSYQYYNNNLRSQMKTLESGITSSTWSYTYDNANRPQTLADPSGVTTTFGFDLADRLTSKAFSNGPTTTLAYDTCDEVQSITTKNGGGSVLVQAAYTYDPAGNVATRTDTDGTIASFGYNGGDQLTAESYYQGGVNSYITYSYDHNGNRATQNVNNSALTTYAYNGTDELTSDSNGGTYTYDLNGNWTKLVSGGNTYLFQYDAENRLTYYQSPSASSSYVYNSAGLRVTESDSGTSGEHDYLHDGAAPASGLLVDSNLTGSNLFHVYTPGIDQSDAGTGAVHLMAEDALGTVRGFVNDNAAGAVTDTFGAFAFGAPRTRTGSDAFSLAWGGADGYQTDANGLVLMGNRVYHVYTGRFLTRDPAHAGTNGYEYADDDPIGKIDPTGLEATPFQMPGDSSLQQIEAQTIKNGGQPGETYDVTQDGKPAFSFTISGWTTSGTGWGAGLGIAAEFIHGTSNTNRYYGANSTQAGRMRESHGFDQVLNQIIAGQKWGGVNSLVAFGLSGSQFWNGTQAQLGAFSWAFTDPNNPNAGIDITNDITFNSLFYHIPQLMNSIPILSADPELMPSDMKGIPIFPTAWDGGMFGTIHQKIHINFP